MPLDKMAGVVKKNFSSDLFYVFICKFFFLSV